MSFELRRRSTQNSALKTHNLSFVNHEHRRRRSTAGGHVQQRDSREPSQAADNLAAKQKRVGVYQPPADLELAIDHGRVVFVGNFDPFLHHEWALERLLHAAIPL